MKIDTQTTLIKSYPTPIASPIHTLSDIEQLSQQQSYYPLHFSHRQKKRKTHVPVKSPLSMHDHQAVKLDVYGLYNALPRSLLYQTSRPRSDSVISLEKKPVKTGSDHPRSIENMAVQSVAKPSSAVSIDESIDFSLYKDTHHAPILEKKGL